MTPLFDFYYNAAAKLAVFRSTGPSACACLTRQSVKDACFLQEVNTAQCKARNVAHAAFLQHQIEAKQARREQSSC